jgi:predicted kinase
MEGKPTLILVNGLPGTGKTTLAAKLSQDLSLPSMGKDMLKEFFFDTLHTDGREQSRTLGKAVIEMLYILIETYLSHNMSIIIESAFFTEFSRPKIKAILDKHPARVVEVYCFTEQNVRRERFKTRDLSGERHKGHVIASDLIGTDDPEPLEQYAPLEVGQLVKIDTTAFGDNEYAELLTVVKEKLRLGDAQ